MKRLAVVVGIFAVVVKTQAAPLDELIEGYAKEHNFSGSILVQERGSVSYAKSFGLANIQLNVPNTNETKYKIASITKAFTSALVLQLREQGKIDLQKSIKTYLPDYKGEGGDKATIHQLLNHTSGIDNMDKITTADEAIKKGIPLYQLPHSTDELLAQFCSGPLVSPPGKTFSYNNAEYVILGKIIERLGGKSFDEVLKEKVLEPLKLADTGMLYQHQILPGLASTYFMRDDLKSLVNDLPTFPENSYAAGGMYSTPRDVMSFSNALFGEKLINKESLALMITPGLDDYGYGVWSYESKAGDKKFKVVKRPGQIMGAQTQLYHIIDPDSTVVILSNTGTTDLDEFVARIGKQLVAGAK